jgi:pSer/pThr/pTyr-binding forkhead associated (FHA) protein/ABC-type transport system involved in cytochrome c biogenesis ATPase subunit
MNGPDTEQAPAAPAFQLRALSPAPLDSECSIPANGLVIGRDSDQADVVLSASRVSRRHCRVRLTTDGCRIEDLDSTNGVYVNGERIEDPVDLEPGDVIGLGRAEPPDFEFISDTHSPRHLQLAPAQIWLIGRAMSCDLSLPSDPTVSQRHAELRRDGETLQVRDCGSLNGVRVDDKRIGRNNWHPMSELDQLELGNTRLRLLSRDDGGIDVTIIGRNPGLTLSVEQLEDSRIGPETINLRLLPGRLIGIATRYSHRAGVLLELLAGRLSPEQGSVLHDDRLADAGTGRHRIGFVEADHPLDGSLTVWQHLHYTAQLRLPTDMDRGRRDTLLATTLAQLGLDAVRNVRLARLDASHRRLVAIAAELVTRPALLCLDNPFTELDDRQSAALSGRLQRLARTGTTVIVAGIGLARQDVFDELIELDPEDQPPPSRKSKRIGRRFPAAPRASDRISLHRVRMLLWRQSRLRLLDPGTLALYLLLPILLALAGTALAGVDHPLPLVLMTVAVASALFTAAPEISADRWRLRHEVHSGVLPGEDLVARMLFCWIIGAGQMLVVGSGMAWLTGMGLGDGGMLVTSMMFVAFSATALGLMIGTIDPTRARLVMPLAAAFVVLQWLVVTESPPDLPTTAWLFGRIRDLLPGWWGAELLAAWHGGIEHEARRAARAGAFLVGQTITWMVIARGLLGRRIRQPLR